MNNDKNDEKKSWVPFIALILYASPAKPIELKLLFLFRYFKP